MSLIEQAGSILQVFRDSLKDRQVLADESVVKERLTVCEACPFLKEKRGRFACVKCGCGYKRKIAFHASKCPVERW